MKKLFLLLIILFATPALAEEKIINFNSDITVNKDSSLTVTETITVQAVGNQIRHGIYRVLPTKYQLQDGSTRRVKTEIIGVSKDGVPEDYHTKSSDGWMWYYFGNKNILLDAGIYVYQFSYKTTNQMGFYPDFDEVYWNVTGNNWDFPTEKASATVHLPEGANPKNYIAYTGVYGAQGADYTSHVFGNDVSFETTRVLQPDEGITIAVSFPKGVVTQPSKQELFWQNHLQEVALAAVLLIVFAYFMMVWHKFGRDPKPSTIIPLFEPPKGFSPANCQYLSDMGFVYTTSTGRAFSAAMVNLAVKGYVKISKLPSNDFFLMKTGDRYLVKKLNEFIGEDLSYEEKAIGEALFQIDDEVVFGTENNSRVQDAFSRFENSVESQIKDLYFHNNTMWFVIGAILSLVGIIAIPFLGDMLSANHLFLLSLFSFKSVLIVAEFFWLIKGIYKKYKALGSGFFKLCIASFFAVIFAGLILYLGKLAFDEGIGIYAIELLLIVITNFVFWGALKARTVRGRRLYEEIQGFKIFLSVAEKNRFDKFYPPEVTPEIFEKYLPYAIALDVSNEWGAKFAATLLASSAAAVAYSPNWYVGDGFDVQNLTNFNNSFSDGFTTSLAVPSSGSGSGGGGSSGGGGGGGGGGGW